MASENDTWPPGQPQSSLGSPRHDDRLVIVLALATLACTYALVVLGSTVRVTNSGMGCRSWPLCNGQIGPIDQYHSLLEQLHRYLAALVTVAAFATLWAARRCSARRAVLWPATFAAGLVLFQAGLGALTVLEKNAPWTVALHLATALVFLAATTVTAVVAVHGGNRLRISRGPGTWGWVALGATFVLIVSGTLVVDGGAARSCPSWPLCTHFGVGRLIALQLLHRSLAGLAGVSMIGLVSSRWRETTSWRLWRCGATGLLVLLVAVASFGAASALTQARPTWQDIHLTMAAALWMLLVALVTATAVRDTAAPAETKLSGALSST